jgi:hypothetical protein
MLSYPQQEVAGRCFSRLRGQESCTPPEPSPLTATEKYHRLTEEMQFEPEMANLCVDNGMADLLLHFKDTGVEISEENPLLLKLVDLKSPESIAFADSGNYGLPVSHPAALPWPGGQVPHELVPGVSALPPGALGRLIAGVVGVSECSEGYNSAFFLPNLETLERVRETVCAEPQFAMYGPSLAARLQQRVVQPHDCPVKFVTIAKLGAKPNRCEVYYRN